MSTVSLRVPPIELETHQWHAEQDGMSSRAQLARGSGPYESAVPPKIANLQLEVPALLAADVEDAVSALVRFDNHARDRLGTSSPMLGPMSSILLRTESSSSSQIENLTVGARQLALAELNQSTSANAMSVSANVHAMEAALELADRVDRAAILTMHEKLLLGQKDWESHAGRFREQLVWIGSTGTSPRGATFVAPRYELVEDLIEDLVEFVSRDDLPVLVQVAIAHAQLETIHPFVDGNGRTGRALVHALLRGKGLVRSTTAPLSAGLLKNTNRYFEALMSYRAGDAGPICEQFAAASRFAAHSGAGLIDKLGLELDAARGALAGLRPQAMAWALLPHLVSHPVMNTELVTGLLGTSQTSALRALAQLQDAGVVVERSGYKRNRVWQHDGILAVLDGYAAELLRA
ncbi:Fic family protein [Paeniglutamicibacter psychrophenolicus]|uniref:Fic family protein n=1 Tax=Paeniglutamicibacter psychrophenolicus TaxID=257454 RepID=A0ABS4WEJ2_9MICC|nr:Fic family protein [Paeniglutamicibacter psychrophenolicus]MBP2374623.1 Fic family protein [Paeniglutamicibacter psychrophenolicus]